MYTHTLFQSLKSIFTFVSRTLIFFITTTYTPFRYNCKSHLLSHAAILSAGDSKVADRNLTFCDKDTGIAIVFFAQQQDICEEE